MSGSLCHDDGRKPLSIRVRRSLQHEGGSRLERPGVPRLMYTEAILPQLAPPVALAPPLDFATGHVPHTELRILYLTAQGERIEEIEVAPEEDLLAARSILEGIILMPREGLVRC